MTSSLFYIPTVPENAEEKAKRKKIEDALDNPETTLDEWRNFAKSEYGLINGISIESLNIYSMLLIVIISDDLRKRVWPLLLSLDKENNEPAPQLEELSNHPEYNQVVLDVNRSLKRFPPGIPYDQRVALQDQLTVLILRVITKFPHLSYYQVSFRFIFGITFITLTNIITTYTFTNKNKQ